MMLCLTKFKLYLSLYANSEKNRWIKHWLGSMFPVKYVWAHVWLSAWCISLICTAGSSLFAIKNSWAFISFPALIEVSTQSSPPIFCSCYCSDSVDLHLSTTLYVTEWFSYTSFMDLKKILHRLQSFLIWLCKMIYYYYYYLKYV